MTPCQPRKSAVVVEVLGDEERVLPQTRRSVGATSRFRSVACVRPLMFGDVHAPAVELERRLQPLSGDVLEAPAQLR
jgi:hypothetical protein